MSLLLDARKKSQETQGGNGGRSGFELSLEEHPDTAVPPAPASSSHSSHNAAPSSIARSAGQNLFSAKSSIPSAGLAGINRNLLFALGGTLVLLASGGGYVWYVSSSTVQPSYPVARPPAQAVTTQPPPVTAEASPESDTPETPAAKPVRTKQPTRTARSAAKAPTQQKTGDTPMYIERRQAESIDPLLNRAYLAYREGKFDQAQQLYSDALRQDERNSDALLGLAAVAQRRGADGTAAHYYAKVLELNPRDAVANAGMSALTTDENRESRLKMLLIEQPNSSPLHFALGNHYAAQERWGEAQQAYFNACKLEPGNAALAFNLAVSLERLGQKKLAAQYYLNALQLDPSHSEGFDHAQISKRIEELTR
jgi:Flp pilus assembly protein TadD